MKHVVRAMLALAGGFALSFVGVGVLWIGTPWAYQMLMFIPFLLLAFAITVTSPAGDHAFLLVIAGAAPIGALLTLFRDRNDSHLMSILVVCAWLAGTLAGQQLAAMRLRRAP
jgi:hypothetical protein